MSNALVVVDVENDFCESGSLPVEGGFAVARGVAEEIANAGPFYAKKVATKDWHNPLSDNGEHFAEVPDFKDTWPAHCVANGPGSDFAHPLHPLLFDAVFHKGWDEPAYSGFQGNSASHPTDSLEDYLRFAGIKRLYVCGIATDYCVKATVLDGIDRGFEVVVLSGLTAAVGDKRLALKEMEAAGAVIA